MFSHPKVAWNLDAKPHGATKQRASAFPGSNTRGRSLHNQLQILIARSQDHNDQHNKTLPFHSSLAIAAPENATYSHEKSPN